MWKKILASLAVPVVLFLAVVALQPDELRVERSTTIAAPPPVVFAEVNDLHRMEAWNPWAKIDPAMKRSYAGPAEGEGASYRWAGNHEVGEGRMTIVESRPHQRIRMKLEFLKPFAATNSAEFTFTPSGEQTTVTWAMLGTNDFLGKAIGLVMDMDAMIGDQFEKGLADMKSIAEAAAKS